MSGPKKQVTHAKRQPRPNKPGKAPVVAAPALKPAEPASIVESSPSLKPDEARAVLKKHAKMRLINLVGKAVAGKTLSKREHQEIAQFAEPSALDPAKPHTEWVSSYERLGLAVGLHRASFPRIRRDKPDAPKPRANGDHSVNAWREFLAVHPEIQCRSAASAPVKSELELEKLKQQCRRIKFDNDLSEGLYLLRSDVDGWVVETVETIKAKLPAKLLNELPPKLEGLRAAEIAAKLEPIIAEICDLLRFIHAKAS